MSDDPGNTVTNEVADEGSNIPWETFSLADFVPNDEGAVFRVGWTANPEYRTLCVHKNALLMTRGSSTYSYCRQ